MSEIELSVIVINFNTFQYTRKCIESVYNFTKDISFEVILVDNASTEGDITQLKNTFQDIILIRNNVNEGFARANNQGIKISKGAKIILLNSDTYLVENSFKVLTQLIDELPGSGVVSPLLRYPNGKIQHSAQSFPSVKKNLVELFRLQKINQSYSKTLAGSFFDHNQTVETDWVWGTCFMLKAEVISKMDGLLDEKYFMYGEDRQWCLDIRKLGYEIWHTNRTHIVHIGGGSGMQNSVVLKKRETDFLIRNYSFYYRLVYSFTALLLQWDRFLIDKIRRI